MEVFDEGFDGGYGFRAVVSDAVLDAHLFEQLFRAIDAEHRQTDRALVHCTHRHVDVRIDHLLTHAPRLALVDENVLRVSSNVDADVVARRLPLRQTKDPSFRRLRLHQKPCVTCVIVDLERLPHVIHELVFVDEAALLGCCHERRELFRVDAAVAVSVRALEKRLHLLLRQIRVVWGDVLDELVEFAKVQTRTRRRRVESREPMLPKLLLHASHRHESRRVFDRALVAAVREPLHQLRSTRNILPNLRDIDEPSAELLV
mmetsp:Transcript_25436/g.83681  ORF Transcript_25436/g.83681 Transcript_25436/m.83681 type:complete len:260 (-) Transcript_25436:288-1067(-)